MPVVDIAFKIQGQGLSADHAYDLLAAVSGIVTELHGDAAAGIHASAGLAAGARRLRLQGSSRLAIRLDADRISQVLPLAGKTLRVGGDAILLGVPEIRPLLPTARLYSRLVVIKGFMEPAAFLEAARRQLARLEIKGEPALARKLSAPCDPATGEKPYLRRTLRIRDVEIVGFALHVNGLTADESIRLQEHGLGGRRRFGCGIFIPDRRQPQDKK